MLIKYFEALFQNMDKSKLIEILLSYGLKFVFSKNNGIYFNCLQ